MHAYPPPTGVDALDELRRHQRTTKTEKTVCAEQEVVGPRPVRRKDGQFDLSDSTVPRLDDVAAAGGQRLAVGVRKGRFTIPFSPANRDGVCVDIDEQG